MLVKFNKSHAIYLYISFQLLIFFLDGNLFSANKRDTMISLNEFYTNMKDQKSFKIYADGMEKESHISSNKYIYYESIAFYGKDDIQSTYQILYHTENDIIILYNNIKVQVSYREMRTYLEPSFEKAYTTDEKEGYSQNHKNIVQNIFKEEKIDKVLLAEYGIKKNTEYFAHFKIENYKLPPIRPDGKPQNRKKLIINISNQEFPNNIRITPLYKNWSY